MLQTQSFDYVVVGSGPSSMGLLYGMLVPYTGKEYEGQEPPFQIAVIERGLLKSPSEVEVTKCPGKWSSAATDKFTSTSSKDLAGHHVQHIPSDIHGRKIRLPVGQGLGGTSNINACYGMLPKQSDFQRWPKVWSENMIGACQDIQNVMDTNGCFHRTISNDEYFSTYTPFQDKAFDLTTSLPLFVSPDDDGSGRYVRKTYYEGLIKPLLEESPHLKNYVTFLMGTEAQRLVFKSPSDRRIHALECYSSSEEKYFQIAIQKEVIICAGTFETPALLLVSGVGDQVRGIGKCLQDQPIIPICFWTRYQSKPYSSVNGVAALGTVVTGTGSDAHLFFVDAVSNLWTLPLGIECGIRRVVGIAEPWKSWAESALDVIAACCKKLMYYSLAYTPVGYILAHHVGVALLCVLNPKSAGSVWIEAKQKQDTESQSLRRREVNLKARVGYLEDEPDMQALQDAYQMCVSRLNKHTWNISPCVLAQKLNKPEIFRSYCKVAASGYYHYSGTCSIKSNNADKDWIVDEDLKLRGHRGIRVCDASIFPQMISVPPALTCAATGYIIGQRMNKLHRTKG